MLLVHLHCLPLGSGTFGADDLMGDSSHRGAELHFWGMAHKFEDARLRSRIAKSLWGMGSFLPFQVPLARVASRPESCGYQLIVCFCQPSGRSLCRPNIQPLTVSPTPCCTTALFCLRNVSLAYLMLASFSLCGARAYVHASNSDCIDGHGAHALSNR